MSKTEWNFEPFAFTSEFDSGNLARVEFRSRDTGGEQDRFEFDVWTAPDCAESECENSNRTWFYFAVVGQQLTNKTLRINVRNLNRQTRLYQQGMAPFVRTVPGRVKWERIKERPLFEMCDGSMVLSFDHTFTDHRRCTTYFSFCYPFSYTDCQKKLDQLEQQYNSLGINRVAAQADEIYFQRELLINSLDGRRVDCLTVTSCRGITTKREDRLEGLFPCGDCPRPFTFKDKKVFFLSSRVHPGETPSSFIFNGFLDFILRRDDPRAAALRDRFVFKLIPMLNPDGIFRGHYRTDQRGVNLNRVYLNPDCKLHPSIFAAHALLLYYHNRGNALCVKRESRKEWLVSKETIYRCQKLQDFDVEKSSQAVVRVERNCQTQMNRSLSICTPNRKDSLCHSASQLETSAINGSTNAMHRSVSDFSGSISCPPNSLKCQQDSGLAFYVDLHGHANKQGCFMYGNHFDDISEQTENILLPKLVSLNSAHFDFKACNFSVKNMYARDKGNGSSKEGSGRVGIFKTTGIIHCYTLEGNYNSGRQVNSLSPATMDDGHATPPPLAGFPPRFTIAMYEEVGRGLAIAALDMIDCNPWSRLPSSEYKNLAGVREWVRSYIKGCRVRSEVGKNPRISLSERAMAIGSSSPEPVSSVPSSEPIPSTIQPKTASYPAHYRSKQLIASSIQQKPIQPQACTKRTSLLDRRKQACRIQSVAFSDGELEQLDEQETITLTRRKGSLPSTFSQQVPQSRQVKGKSHTFSLSLMTQPVATLPCNGTVLKSGPAIVSTVTPSLGCHDGDQWLVATSQKSHDTKALSDWVVTSVPVSCRKPHVAERLTSGWPRRVTSNPGKR